MLASSTYVFGSSRLHIPDIGKKPIAEHILMETDIKYTEQINVRGSHGHEIKATENIQPPFHNAHYNSLPTKGFTLKLNSPL